MEKFRRKRSGITAVTDCNPADSFSLNERILRGGNRHARRNLHNVASGSSSSSSGFTDENSFALDCDWKPSKQVFGASVKNLLADEMTGETDFKRRSPSIIAKLMGLDGLPPQHSTHRPQKSSENLSNRSPSLKKAQRSGALNECQFSRRNSEQEFKDVFEVLESRKVESVNCSSHTTEKVKLAEAEMAFIRQRFLDAKRLSTNEKLQHSKEFQDAIEILDTNKDLLLKFLHQPDSLFPKHLKDLRVSLPQSNCRSIRSINMSDIHKDEKMDNFSLKSKRDNLLKSHKKSCQKKKHCDGHFRHLDSDYAGGSSIIEGEDEVPFHQPTRIVVLKPNLGKAKGATDIALRPYSAHDSHSNNRKHIELSCKKGRKFEATVEKRNSNDRRNSRQNHRESRELAKGITRQMRDSISANSANSNIFGLEECAMEESSKNMCVFETADELSHLSNLHNRNASSSSRTKESPVSWEAKKRLSERWKMTQNSHQMGIVSRAGTLADMLGRHDREILAALSDEGIREDGYGEKFYNDDDASEHVEPLGISSRDGWKDECIGRLTRSRSLPSSTTGLRNPKTRHIPDACCADRYLVQREALKYERKGVVERKFVKREGSVHKNSKTRLPKSHSSQLIATKDHDRTMEARTSNNQVKINFQENDAHEKDLLIFETSCSMKDTSLDIETVVDKSLAEGDACSAEQDDLVSEDGPSESSKDNSVQLHAGPGIETQILSKETDQPSPVSVLEPPFPDDLSSSCSDCFESLSADLHGLRMQLQLLKLESEEYAERPILSMSEDDIEAELIWFSDEHKLHSGATWEISYLIDVLNHSALNDADINMFVASWHSPDCPIDPSYFEELEKKWSDQTQKKYERKLLFNCINTAILDLYRQLNDPHPWVRQTKTRLKFGWIEGGLHDDLCKLLANQAKEVKKETVVGKDAGREDPWLNFGDEIDETGREIERLLIDDLVAEVAETKCISSWSCNL